jgi:hypothetical protein
LAQPEAFPVLRAELIALGLPAVVMQIRRYDQTAANLLETLIKPVEEAEAFLAREFGRTAATFGPPARLWLLALSGEAALRATVLQLKTEHVCSTNAALESLLHATSLAPYQVLVLARAADNPRHFGLLTHEEVRRRRLAQLLEEADDLAQIIFWQRLAEAMRAGLLVFGRHRHLIGTGVGAIFLLAVHVPGLNGVALGLAPLAAAFGLRLLGNRLQATAVARWALRAKPWSWRDGIARCGAELRALGQREDAAPSSVLRRQFESLVAEIRKIARADESAHLRLPPRPFATWALGQAGWLLALLLVGASAWYGYRQPPSWSAHVAAWERVFASSTAPGTPSDLISWPYRPSLIAEPTEIRSLGAFVPTPEQQRHALARGRQLVAPYQPETINALVAVLVQTENGEGLLLFDGRKGTLVPGKGTRIGFVPERKTWLGLEGQRVLFIER